jgi:hypothetical protein
MTVLSQPMSGQDTTAFLKNVVAFHLKHRRVFLKGGHLFKKDGHLFYYMFMQ